MVSTKTFFLSTYSALLLALNKPVNAEETTTFTHTNFIYPDCFKNQIDSAFLDNPPAQTAGIPVVLVYEGQNQGDGSGAQGQNTITTSNQPATSPTAVVSPVNNGQEHTSSSSSFHYTVSTDYTELDTITSCSNKVCSTTITNKKVPHYYTTTVHGDPVTKTTSLETRSTTHTASSAQAAQNDSQDSDTTEKSSLVAKTSTKSTLSRKAKTTPDISSASASSETIQSVFNKSKPVTMTESETKDTKHTTTLSEDGQSSTRTNLVSETVTVSDSSDNDRSVISEYETETEHAHHTTTQKNGKLNKSSLASETATIPDSSSKSRSTLYDYETETNEHTEVDTVTAKAKIATVAKTTTKTIYKASTKPVRLYRPSTTTETKTTTEKNPLLTAKIVTKTLTKTIDASKITNAVTIDGGNKKKSSSSSSGSAAESSGSSLVPSGSLSSESPLYRSSAVETDSSVSTGASTSKVQDAAALANNSASSVPTSLTTSTIDLRISSSSISAETLSSQVNVIKYGNSSSSSSSPLTLSRGSASSTALASSLSDTLLSSSAQASTLASSSSPSSEAISSSSKSTLRPGKLAASSTESESAAPSASVSDLSVGISVSASLSIGASSASDNCDVTDLFEPVATDSPLDVFPRKELPLDIPDGVNNDDVPYETNKFYANLFLDSQTDMIWSYPYGLYWKTQDYYGFGVQHTNVSDRIFGSQDTNNEDVDSYYYNPTNNAELIFSATTFSKDNNHMSVSESRDMSVLVKLSAEATAGDDYIEIPIVQGMGFVTGVYNGDLIPELDSLIGFDSLNQESSSALSDGTLKYRATLFNGVEWLIYVSLPDSGDGDDFELSANSSYKISGNKSLDGVVIQLAVAPEKSSQDGYYDEAAGKYATSAEVTGSLSGCSDATYSFKYSTKGTSSSDKTIVFALPHHVESLTDSTKDASTGIKLASTTKGNMYAYLTNELKMSESLETDIGFLPWTQNMTGSLSYSAKDLKLLAEAANSELSVDIDSTVQGADSTYSSGKLIDKYSYILLVVNDILQDENVANSTLQDMKDAFEPFFKNKQYYPLMYDTKWGGLTSTAAQDGDSGADYGAPYYNDHHFHYGYYVHAAAVVGYVDKKLGGSWAEDNKDWVNSLIRDVANPSSDDSYFPVSRMFDWFAGHSWASGLFVSGDGRNEESTSEDYNFAYGMKLWGKVIDDGSMEHRGDLMLSIMSRAMNKYFYYTSDNDVEPSEIIKNKVSGIFFDNKVTYTTYFGSPDKNPEYVHGIHMLPITPASSLIRGPKFVKEEWDDQISGFIDDVESGWTGILRLNQALFDPKSSYEFFSADDFDSDKYLDNGQSRTWSLAFSGGIANAS